MKAKFINENISDILKPKTKDEILENIYKEIKKLYRQSVGFWISKNTPEINSPIANNYFDLCFIKNGSLFGLYVMVSDNDIYKLETIMNDIDVNYNKIGHSTYKIYDHENKEKQLIMIISSLIIKKEMDNIMLKKF